MKNDKNGTFLELYPEIADQWHPTKNEGLKPEDVSYISGKKVWWTCNQGADHEWITTIYNRIYNRNGCPYCANQKVSVTNKLSTNYPALTKEWHPDKNGTLSPENLVYGSTKKVWWKCDKGDDHEWQTAINQRTNPKTGGSGCPFCANLKVSTTNSLNQTHPEVAAEWHSTKNGQLTPDQVVYGAEKKVWWKCDKGDDHEWQAVVSARTKKDGTGCPYCANQKVSVTNKLSTNYPALTKEWHPDKNGTLSPENLVYGSTKKVWWKCDKGDDHEWQTAINQRTNPKTGGSGCPFCANLKVSTTNSLNQTHPEVAAEWHSTKNGQLTPDSITRGSNKKVWWKCNRVETHQWQAKTNDRTNPKTRGSGCPFCSGNKISELNSLASNYPEVATQWHPTKNGDLTPDKVSYASGKRVWWKCSAGPDHEWITTVASRTKEESGCPCCSGYKVSQQNRLSRLFPEVAIQWHPTKNGDLTPDKVSYASGKRVWWKCGAGPDHEWITSIANRTHNESSCPCCAGRKVSVTNNLANTYPEIASQWHKTKNGQLTPKNLSWGSKHKVWWECSLGHEWETTVRARTRLKTNCPTCDLTPRSKIEIYLAHEMSHFFEIDIDDFHVQSPREIRPLLVDIKMPNQKLIIEYDGAYWHKGKEQKLRDFEKTRQLTQIGWIVIRIRLDKQEKISDDDILMEAEDHKDAKSVANNLILKLVELGYLQQSDYDSYQARDSLINEEKAEAYIQQLLNAKVDKSSQLDLFDN